jgi:hypothetical protein
MDNGHLEDLRNHFDDGYKLGHLDGILHAYQLVFLLIDSGVPTIDQLSSKLQLLITNIEEEHNAAERII